MSDDKLALFHMSDDKLDLTKFHKKLFLQNFKSHSFFES